MKPCGMAGVQCPREATVTVRIAGIGDRHLCAECWAWMQNHGMDARVLPAEAFVPEWRKRSLLRDFTNRVLA